MSVVKKVYAGYYQNMSPTFPFKNRLFVILSFPLCSLIIGCSSPWVDEGTVPQTNLFVEALRDIVEDPQTVLSENAKIFIASTFVLFRNEKKMNDAYPVGFDFHKLCREFFSTQTPVGISTTVVALDAKEREGTRRIYGYIPAESWYVPETGNHISILSGKGFLLCSTSEMPVTEASVIFGAPTWTSKNSPNVQPIFLDEL
jgi:hypothetical protein